jgi:hypothetical protein
MVEEADGLTTDDLLNVLRVINTATERGAFKAHELSFVGNVYDKFTGLLRNAQNADVQSTDAIANEKEVTGDDANGSK